MPRGKDDIVLFGGGAGGFGWARNPGSDVYHWGVGSDCRSGRWVPSAAYARVLSEVAFAPIACLFEWESTEGYPTLIWTSTRTGDADAYILEFTNGTLTATAHPTASNQSRFTSGVLYRFDQDATEDANEAMAFFCNGYGNDVIVRRKKSAAGSPTIDTGATTGHDAKADLLAVVGADLYRVVSDYKVGKLTADTDPGVDANYPTLAASIPAGRPSWPINTVVSLGGSPILLKGDGVFKYNSAPSVATCTQLLRVTPHPDNGKGGTTDGRSRVYYPSRENIVVITFGFQSLQTPVRRIEQIDRNTPFGRIDRFAVDLDHIYAFVAPGFAKTQDGVGLKVFSDDGPGVFTDETTSVTDRKFSTSADWTALANGDYIWVGCDEPFSGVYLEFGDNVRASTTAATALAASYGSSGPAYTACTVIDSTLCFAQDGLITFHTSRQHPYDASTAWIPTTVNGVEKYWIRLEVKSALTAVKAHTVSVLPYRPPIDPDGNNVTDATAITGYGQATALPRLLVGTWRGESVAWQDFGPLWTGKIEQAVVGRVNDGVTDAETALYFLGPDGLYAMPIGAEGNPAMTSWPNLGDTDAFATGIGAHGMKTSADDFGVSGTVQVDTLLVNGGHLQSDDELWVYTRWDEADRWERSGPHAHLPVAIPVPGSGNALEVYWAYKDGSRDAYAPYIEEVVVPAGQWSYESDEFLIGVEADATSPQSV